MIRDVVAAVGFGAFVAFGIASARLSPPERAAHAPPRRVRVVVGIGIFMCLFAGLTRRELWPFATWSLMPGTTSADVRVRALVCADSAGHSFAIDHRAWAPLTEEELLSFVNGPLAAADAQGENAARARLLRMAEAARLRVRSGGKASPLPSPLGPFAASSHLLHPSRWNDPGDTPSTPCVALRLIERRWDVDSVAAGHGGTAEATLWEYQP